MFGEILNSFCNLFFIGSSPNQSYEIMWVEFVGSLLSTERFSPGTPVSPFLKNQHLTFICVNC